MGRLHTSHDPDADTLIVIPENTTRDDTSDREKAILEIQLRKLPAAQIIPIMGLKFDHVCAQASKDKLQRMSTICGQCVIQKDCLKNLKSCMRNADMIDMCPLWDCDLIE